jgi:hypothetical protein
MDRLLEKIVAYDSITFKSEKLKMLLSFVNTVSIIQHSYSINLAEALNNGKLRQCKLNLLSQNIQFSIDYIVPFHRRERKYSPIFASNI